jgi:lysozyme
MARISTGQTYGPTGRKTSQRLLGGGDMPSLSGEIARGQMAPAAIQPQASPVNTFISPGQGMQFGGPVSVPRPPDPQAPNGDMEALAKSLGSFNQTLGVIGETYTEYRKQQEAAAKVAGAQFGAQLEARFPGQNLAQLRDTLLQKAAAGDEEAAAALTMLKAKDPLELRFTDVYLQRSRQRVDLNTALSRWQATTTVTDDDGTVYQINDLEPGHPLALRKMNELVPVPQDTAVFMEDLAVRQDVYRQMTQDHAKQRVARKAQESSAAVQGDVTSIFMTPDQINPAAGAAQISQMLTDVRMYLGPERYREEVERLNDYLVSGALAGSVVDGKYDMAKYNANMQAALAMQREIKAGPNGEPLLSWLGAKGGTEAQLSLANKLMEQYGKIRGNLDSMSGFAGQDTGRNVISKYNLDDPAFAASDPLGYERAQLQARGEESSLPMEQRGAFRAEIDKAVNGTKFAPEFTQNQIERQEFDRLGSLDADPAAEIARIKERVRTGQMTPAQGRQYMNQWQEQQGQELLPIRQAADKEINRLLELYEKQYNLDGVVTQEERDKLIALRANLSMNVRRQVSEGVKGGKGYGQVQQEVLNTLKNPALLPAPPEGGPNSKPKFKDAKEWGDSLGMFGRNGRGNAAANQNLKLSVEKGVIFSGEQFEKYYNNWVGKGEMDPDLKLMIQRSGYGKNPSQFFIRQWNNLYNRDPNRDPIPVPGIEKLQQRDKDGMRATPSAASLEGRMMPFGMIDPMRMQSSSQRLMENLQGVINAAFIPPASAGDMSMATATRGAGSTSVPPTGGSQVAVRAVPAQTRALLRTIRFAEGTAHADGYRTMFTGAKFNDLSRHPRRIMRSGDLASDAAGAYQFLSTTWDSVSGGAMSPVRQDLAAIRLIQARGVDPGLPSGFTKGVADKLSREWASFPTAATGTSYYGQGGKSFKQLKAYYDRVLREEMARGR